MEQNFTSFIIMVVECKLSERCIEFMKKIQIDELINILEGKNISWYLIEIIGMELTDKLIELINNKKTDSFIKAIEDENSVSKYAKAQCKKTFREDFFTTI